MKLAPSLARRTAAAALAATAVLGASGCSAVNYQATTHQYSASNGIIHDLGEVGFRNIALVSTEEDGPARLIGTVVNDGTEPVEASVAVAGDTFGVEVPAGGTVSLEHDEEFVVDSLPAAPGAVVTVTLTADGESAESEATVLDGVLEQYRDLVPQGYDESVTEHLEHGPDTYGAGAAHHGEGGGH